jgi:hypothetical protein
LPTQFFVFGRVGRTLQGQFGGPFRAFAGSKLMGLVRLFLSQEVKLGTESSFLESWAAEAFSIDEAASPIRRNPTPGQASSQ